MKIITNNQARNLIYGYELTERERKDFDYIDQAEFDTHNFFRYKGQVYDPSEFMPCPKGYEPARQELNALAEWDGYQSDSYFSGICIKYTADFEQVIIGTYMT